MSKVIKIVKAHLTANGFDGLVNCDAECGCLMSEGLHPCGDNFADCKPGYKNPVPDGRPDDWVVSTERPAK